MDTHQVSREMKIETKASVSKNETPPQEGISQEKNEEKELPVSENKTPTPCSEEWLFHFPKCGQGVGILFSKMICKKPKKNLKSHSINHPTNTLGFFCGRFMEEGSILCGAFVVDR